MLFRSVKVIQENIKKCHLEHSNHEILAQDAFVALPKLAQNKETFNLIYLDPPYTVDSIFIPIMELLSSLPLLKEEGEIVIRTRKEKEMPERFGNLVKYREKVYGISKAHFYRKEEESDV